MTPTILITGASSGIGEATARYFLQKGWNVAATMRDPKKGGKWTDSKSIIFPCLDVTAPETITAAVTETLEHFGQINVLVNNAGYALMGPLEGITLEQFNQQLQTNLFGIVSTMQAVIPILRQQGSGTIINVTSIGGRIGFPLVSSYHASKWAVEGLSEAIRYELRPFGIGVKIIEPGGIKTNFINHGTVWAHHPDYADAINQVKQFSRKINDSLPAPEGVARTIYSAAIDPSDRLRYSSYAKAFLLLHKLLPDILWRYGFGRCQGHRWSIT
jgi:NAD(P)-dependent dehydrogenase (short-subunit alcohol dehydrogenase family)